MMMSENKPRSAVRKRITSIDALRTIVLLGILLVHVAGLFGWGRVPCATSWGYYLCDGISSFLVHRCASIFAILFGVSFYLILLNPANTTKKFVWRCFLLVLIGLFNKIFYTSDALMWYGMWGMVLAGFRHLPVRKLWISFFVILVLNLFIKHSIDWSFTNSRYVEAEGLIDVIRYPVWQAALDYIRMVLKGGVLHCLSLFLLGYCLAKSGIIEHIKEYATMKWLIVFSVLYIILILTDWRFHVPVFKSLGYLCGALCYAILFFMIYNKTYPFFRFLEPYGKLGLTNYSMQGIVGVILTALFFIPYHWPFEYILVAMLLFYVLQVVFSIIWLKHFKYGPLEWLWRCATEKKWLTNKVSQ